MDSFKCKAMASTCSVPSVASRFDLHIAQAAQKFLKSIPGFNDTPLVELSALSSEIGIGKFFVKDESSRLGLNAFKGAGICYAVAKYIAKYLDIPLESISYSELCTPEVKEKLKGITFVTATDGNHGRGLARAGKMFGVKVVVYMPKDASQRRLQAVLEEGAEASIVDMDYDGAVQLATNMAKEKGWVLMQDTAFGDYTEIPTWIMEGYTVIGLEILQQLISAKQEQPTHIFLQVGVGSFAGALAGFFRNVCPAEQKIIAIEPNRYGSVYLTALKNDGEFHFQDGPKDTLMRSLAADLPSTIGWDVLKDCCDFFLTCPESAGAQGMRILANPLENDTRVTAGAAGAMGPGALVQIMTEPSLVWLKEQLGLNEFSRVLFVNTEGYNDPDIFREVLWNGLYSKSTTI